MKQAEGGEFDDEYDSNAEENEELDIENHAENENSTKRRHRGQPRIKRIDPVPLTLSIQHYVPPKHDRVGLS